MAGARPLGASGRVTAVDVPKTFSNGNKFIKFDNESSVGVPVTLYIDPKGYILYWKDQNKEMDCLDMSCIRDTRTGQYAQMPKDHRLRETINMGTKDCSLEDKIVTVCHGNDVVNVNFVSFSATSKEIAKEWKDMIFKCATNIVALNGSVMQFLEKCYTKLTLVRDKDEKIPVRNIIQTFAQNKEDRRKIQQSLEMARLPCTTSEKLDTLRFENFFSFYFHLCGRQEVNDVFHRISKSQKPYLTTEQFVHFLNNEQRDSRLNEVLYPHCDVKKAKAIIEQHECNRQMATTDKTILKGQLSEEGFLRYLLSQENMIIPTERLGLCCDMNQPLSHYFINSSHNTYLTGHQVTGKSSVEIYRQVLLSGCRCIELDCWDGKGADEEPIITHGFTMCTEVLFKEVIEAISESAFKVSDYPVILSFENHCSEKQQAKMALYCRNILGDALLVDPLDSHKLEPMVHLPSPELLKRKILIKNKKKRSLHSCRSVMRSQMPVALPQPSTPQPSTPPTPPPLPGQLPPINSGVEGTKHRYAKLYSDDNRHCLLSDVVSEEMEEELDSESESDKESELTEEEVQELDVVKQEKGTSGQEVEVGLELSSLVNYVQPARFHTFEFAEKRNRSYECTSFVETQATALLKSHPVDFVNYNKRQLSRIYPKGTRVVSSNYMPQIFWNAGCQLVALNFQTLDLPMQLNLGFFEYNARSGYILKPDSMRRKDRPFDPFTELTVDGIVAGTVKVKIISGQFLTDRKVGTYVEVDMFGLPADTVRRKFRTKTCPNNGMNPVYSADEDHPFVFPKVILPNLAILRVAVYQDGGTVFLGHRILPVESLRPGYRHISLHNEFNQPLGLATLFVHITIKDFVPDGFADLAEALSNPIAYQSKLEKRSHQLEVFEIPSECEPNKDFQPNTSKPNCSNSLPRGFETEKFKPNDVDLPSESLQSDSASGSISSDSSGLSLGVSKPSPISEPDRDAFFSLPRSQQRRVSADNRGQIDLDMSIERGVALGPIDTIEEFKQSKSYQKLLLRYDKELEALQIKNEKLRAGKLQQQQIDMLKAAKDYFKAISDAQKLRDLQKLHQEEALECFRQLNQTELDLGRTFQTQLSTRLQRIVASDRDMRLARIEKAHTMEIAQLKKIQDAQNWDTMKDLAKKYKDKDELAKVRREAMQMNIKTSVQERQRLIDTYDELVSRINAMYDKVFQEIDKERVEAENKLSSLFEEKCSLDVTKYATPKVPKDEIDLMSASTAVVKTVHVTEYGSTRF